MTLYNYITGFILSLALTLAAYVLATYHTVPSQAVVGGLVLLAFAQLVVQLVFFLHLTGKGASRERLVIFAAAFGVVTILVAGSLWIMYNLNQRMMPSEAQMQQYMDNQQGL